MCGDYSIAETDWAACCIAKKGNCPNNFIKLDDDGACAPSSVGDRHWVCCLMTQNTEFKVNLI